MYLVATEFLNTLIHTRVNIIVYFIQINTDPPFAHFFCLDEWQSSFLTQWNKKSKMVNGLYLYSALSSLEAPITSHYSQSFTHSHTPMAASYWIAATSAHKLRVMGIEYRLWGELLPPSSPPSTPNDYDRTALLEIRLPHTRPYCRQVSRVTISLIF